MNPLPNHRYFESVFLKCISILLPELGVFLLYFTNKTKIVMELKMYLGSI